MRRGLAESKGRRRLGACGPRRPVKNWALEPVRSPKRAQKRSGLGSRHPRAAPKRQHFVDRILEDPWLGDGAPWPAAETGGGLGVLCVVSYPRGTA